MYFILLSSKEVAKFDTLFPFEKLHMKYGSQDLLFQLYILIVIGTYH